MNVINVVSCALKHCEIVVTYHKAWLCARTDFANHLFVVAAVLQVCKAFSSNLTSCIILGWSHFA